MYLIYSQGESMNEQFGRMTGIDNDKSEMYFELRDSTFSIRTEYRRQRSVRRPLTSSDYVTLSIIDKADRHNNAYTSAKPPKPAVSDMLDKRNELSFDTDLSSIKVFDSPETLSLRSKETYIEENITTRGDRDKILANNTDAQEAADDMMFAAEDWGTASWAYDQAMDGVDIAADDFEVTNSVKQDIADRSNEELDTMGVRGEKESDFDTYEGSEGTVEDFTKETIGKSIDERFTKAWVNTEQSVNMLADVAGAVVNHDKLNRSSDQKAPQKILKALTSTPALSQEVMKNGQAGFTKLMSLSC